MLSRGRDVLIKIILAAFNLGAFAGIDPVFPELGVSERGVRVLIETFLVMSVNSQLPIMTDV